MSNSIETGKLENVKRGRGRPPKPKIKDVKQEKKKEQNEKKEFKEESIIVAFPELSDDENETENTDQKHKTKINDESISESDEEEEDDEDDVPSRIAINEFGTTPKSTKNDDLKNNIFTFDKNGQKNPDIKRLLEEIRKRDELILSLKNKLGKNTSLVKSSGINYHCVQLANTEGKVFKPEKTDMKCWWCDEHFDNIPVYMPNNYKSGVYYVFGLFCSFNCAATYNLRMLNDYKCNARYALLNNLKYSITKDDTPIKLAPERELLKSKGGLYTIERFRDGFVNMMNPQINMPPIIPLVHVIDDNNASQF